MGDRPRWRRMERAPGVPRSGTHGTTDQSQESLASWHVCAWPMRARSIVDYAQRKKNDAGRPGRYATRSRARVSVGSPAREA